MIGDDYVALFEEAEIRSITGSVIGDSLVSEFYASNVSGDNAYNILGMRTELLPRIQLFGSSLIKKFGREG